MTQASDLPQTLRYEVTGARRTNTLLVAIACTIGGVGFTLAGLSSYTNSNLLPLSNATQIAFLPQGAAMLFYGVVGSAIALYQWLSLSWNLGGGYNEFDRKTGKATIQRNGFPGKNRNIEFQYALDAIQSVRVAIKEGINPKRAVYIKVRGKGEIPLTRVGQPMALSAVEDMASELARFLSVPLEGI
ncbi:photosystem I assembly protein Ycf4 [Synechococcus sp. PCC 7336]|uniref:photosystem I assembly protein Ycf4 n=1 Tax=Synechococcus sp. PCC 7336 TaxID=195250 RepID=UPI000349135A|nr:photosystem I assembly protein Ycf4 [Synechococcus sp. PCC 7336]